MITLYIIGIVIIQTAVFDRFFKNISVHFAKVFRNCVCGLFHLKAIDVNNQILLYMCIPIRGEMSDTYVLY